MKKFFKKALIAFAIAILVSGVCFGTVGNRQKVKAAESFFEYADAGASTDYFIGAPTVVSPITSAQNLNEAVAASEKPESVILTLNDEAKVVGKGGEVIDSFENVMTAIYKKVVPIVKLDTAAAKDAFVELYDNVLVSDMAVISQDYDVLKDARTALPKIRGIYDISDKDYDFSGTDGRKNLTECLKKANSARANVIVLSEKQATREAVEFFQFRFKSVWVNPVAGGGDFDIHKIIASGAYGIVSENYDDVYSVYMQYTLGEEGQLPFVRRPANVAHRGLPATKPENSVAGFVAAVDGGATHVETDVQISMDNKLVLMHDSGIARTTNYTGSLLISQMNYAEIKGYKINNPSGSSSQENVPLLEDAFKALKGKDVVLVLEIKAGGDKIVPLIREKIEEYDFWDQIVIISFMDQMLKKSFDTIPEVPTASLNGLSSTYKQGTEYYNSINTVVDGSLSYASLNFYDGFMKVRGYSGWYWTYNNGYDAYQAALYGVFGLTNNGADDFGKRAMLKIEGIKGQKIKKENLMKGCDIGVKLFDYCGKSEQRVAKIFVSKTYEDHAEVIAYLEDVDVVLYSAPFTVEYAKAGETSTSSNSGGSSSCSSSMGGADMSVCLFALGAVALFINRRNA